MDVIYRKISLRILPLLCLGYVICYMDRVNVSFAQLSMQESLKFSDMTYALGTGIFFWGYFFFEVPSNLILKRIGARVWFAAIMLFWGVATLTLALVKTPIQFYVVRFIIGIAESGFYPGVIYYLNLWYPQKHIGRAFAVFMFGVPISGMIGGPLAGVIIKHMNGLFGLECWQYIFLIEGMLPIIVSIIFILCLPSSSQDATWLTNEEKSSVDQNLEVKSKTQICTEWRKVITIRTVLFIAGYFCITTALYAITFWLPQIVRTFGVQSNSAAASYTAIIWLLACLHIYLISRSSDKFLERRWHFTFIGFLYAVSAYALFYTNNVCCEFILVSFIAGATCSSMTVFWAIVSKFTENRNLAAATALINCVGNLGGYFSPVLVAEIKMLTDDIELCLFLCGGVVIVIAVILMQFLPWKKLHS